MLWLPSAGELILKRLAWQGKKEKGRKLRLPAFFFLTFGLSSSLAIQSAKR